MAKGQVKITGLKELARVLETLPEDVRDKAMNKGTLEGAKMIRDTAISLAPYRTGKLRENIVARKRKDTIFDAEHQVLVRAIGKADNPKNAFYAYFVEFGTSKSAPAPFMRPAVDLMWPEALRNITKHIKRRIARYKKRKKS